MSYRSPRYVVVVAALVAAPLSAQAAGGRGARPNPTAHLESPLKLSLTVGGQVYDVSGTGRCTHSPDAAQFRRLGATWTAEIKPEATTGLRSFGLTVWRFNDAAEKPMFTLFMAIDRAQRRISTMETEAGNGTGTVKVTPQGSGGRFEIDGQTKDGVAIRGTIDCERFGDPMKPPK